jgi:hypothetical protein
MPAQTTKIDPIKPSHGAAQAVVLKKVLGVSFSRQIM